MLQLAMKASYLSALGLLQVHKSTSSVGGKFLAQRVWSWGTAQGRKTGSNISSCKATREDNLAAAQAKTDNKKIKRRSNAHFLHRYPAIFAIWNATSLQKTTETSCIQLDTAFLF